MTLEQRRRAVWGGLILLGMITGFIASAHHIAGFRLPAWGALALVVLVIPAAGYLTLRWWRLLDEVAQEAHKFAWYWGGSAGIMVACLVMILVERGVIPAPMIMGPSVSDAFSAGAVTVLMSQLAGYLVAWAGWWWSHR